MTPSLRADICSQALTRLVALTALTLTLGAACAPSLPPDTIAVVESEPVLYPVFAAYVENATDSSPAALESSVLSHLLDQFLTERLLVQMANERRSGGAAADDREALAALLEAAPAPPPTRAELHAGYREAAEEYRLPERVRLRQVLTETRQAAEAARAEIAGGADFAHVAREHSIDPSAPYGGFQGVLSREDLPEAFVEVIFGLDPGEVSEIVEAEYGFHIFVVTERLPARTVPFEEAAPALLDRMREERERAALDRLVETALSRYTVRIYERNLPFDYRGSLPSAAQ